MSAPSSCIFLEYLHPREFRNLQDSPIRFGTAVNIIAGGNGEGKSNLLEAIGYLSVLKSFRTSRDTEVSRFNSEGFSVSGAIGTIGFLPQNLQITYRRHTGKRIVLNDELIPRFSDVIGLFPTVFLGIEQFPIITEGPKERRRFLDLALSQLYPTYLKSLIRYKRILQQRNSLLLSGNSQQIRAGLQSWNSGLIETGLILAQARQTFLDELREPANRVYANILGPHKQHVLEIQYRPNIDPEQPN
ncbi:MAG: DNA replication and repair protein RecF, partial [Bacteroidetes bacterium]|nr:DNA replication and repair protein RecF [Bacteroidota bacterium]